jgi:hypothetical protein
VNSPECHIICKNQQRLFTDLVCRELAADRDVAAYVADLLSSTLRIWIGYVVPEVCDLICPPGRDGARAWSAHPLELHLVLGPNLCAGTGQGLLRALETH